MAIDGEIRSKFHHTPNCKSDEKKQIRKSPRNQSSQGSRSRLDRYKKVSNKLRDSDQLDYTGTNMPSLNRSKGTKSNSKIRTDLSK